MRMRSTSFLASAVLAALVGCSSGGSSSTIPFDSLQREFATAVCAQFANCPSTVPAGTVLAAIAQHPALYSCADLFTADATFNMAQYRTSIDAGRITYDGAKARACFDALASTCGAFDQVLVGDANCQGALTGHVALGGTCFYDQECVAGTHCDLGSTCPGLCVAAAALGDSCGTGVTCDDNYPGATLSCTTTTANPTMHCVATSFTVVGPGGSCGRVDAVGDEQVEAVCQPGYYCRKVGAATTGTCAAPIPLGQTCVVGTDACVDDTVCQTTGMSSTATCVPFNLTNTAGAACDAASNTYCNPLARLACVGGTCQQVGTGTTSQPCRSSYPTDCNTGLYCDTTGSSDVCLPQVPTGQPCDPNVDRQCASGYCDDVTVPASPVCGTPTCGI